MPSSQQDKICNVLTFVGLLAVIVMGVVSLIPEKGREHSVLEAAQESADTMPFKPDTLEEISGVEQETQVTTARVDTLVSDTLLHRGESVDPSDTAIAIKPHTSSNKEGAEERNKVISHEEDVPVTQNSETHNGGDLDTSSPSSTSKYVK